MKDILKTINLFEIIIILIFAFVISIVLFTINNKSQRVELTDKQKEEIHQKGEKFEENLKKKSNKNTKLLNLINYERI